MPPLVSSSARYELVRMEARPGGGVACFAYRTKRALSPTAHHFYDSRQAAERGCEEDWGVPAASWQTQNSKGKAVALKVLVGSICVFGGAWFLFFLAEKQGWSGLRIMLPAPLLVLWLVRLSWSRILEGGLVCLAAACIFLAGGIAALELDSAVPFDRAIDLLGVAVVISLGSAASVSFLSVLTAWIRHRQRQISDPSAVRRASNGF